MTTLILRRFLARWSALAAGAAALLAILAMTSLPAEARWRHGFYRHAVHFHHASYHRVVFHRRGVRHAYSFHNGRRARLAARAAAPHEIAQPAQDENAGGYLRPSFAAIVVDGNSGRALYANNEHALRHPASVTKVMTLYLLFEQLEKGRLRLDSPIVVSAHAASQAPSKLGLRPGETIGVENAIKAVVTKSANDIAVAIAENIGGDEATFAQMMTRKAHALGMSRTHYANASGLPNPEQVTTAHDLAVLGRAIQDRFPRYYRYFSTHVFAYHGALHRNHNHLLGRVEGVDGIKTGYTRASGFNLLTSVRRGSRRIVAVVMGGRTGAARDRAMVGLIEEHIYGGASVRTARAVTERESAERVAEAEPDIAPEPVRIAAREPVDEAPASVETTIEEEPTPTATIPVRRAAERPAERTAERPSLRAAAAARLAPPVAIAAAPDRARPAFVSGLPKRAADDAAPAKGHTARRESTREKTALAPADGSTARAARAAAVAAAATPASTLRHADLNRTQVARADAGRPARPGWMIQIGATADVAEANQLLSRARMQLQGASVKSFTEKVQKGNETLWRARFAGLEQQSAESACRTLKRSGFSCFATKN